MQRQHFLKLRQHPQPLSQFLPLLFHMGTHTIVPLEFLSNGHLTSVDGAAEFITEVALAGRHFLRTGRHWTRTIVRLDMTIGKLVGLSAKRLGAALITTEDAQTPQDVYQEPSPMIVRQATGTG